jgi:ribokinase
VSRRVVVLGEVMLDVVAFHEGPLAIASDTPARIRLRPGGAGANTAAWLARAGVDVTLIARVGADDAANLALSSLDGVDLSVEADPVLPTGTCVVLVSPGGERTMLPDPGANIALSAEHLPSEVFAEQNILHVSGYSLMRPGSRAAALTAMDQARDAGMLISVDPASAAS